MHLANLTPLSVLALGFGAYATPRVDHDSKSGQELSGQSSDQSSGSSSGQSSRSVLTTPSSGSSAGSPTTSSSGSAGATSTDTSSSENFTSTKEPFDPLHHSGSVSPYFDAPSMISPEVPDGCYVDQAAYIARHGSRYPEPDSYSGWEELYWKIQNTTFAATGPLMFLANWSPILDDTPHQPLYLTATGAGEAFDLGVQLRRGYGFTKGGDNFTVWSAGEQRVIDTSAYFTRGYLSDGNYLDDLSENRGQIVALPDSVNYTFANSLTPGSSCPLFTDADTGSSSADTFRATYQSTVAARMNQYLDGLTLDASDIGVMGDLCGYEAAIDGDTRFCGVFEDDEWLDYEYAQDLNYYYGTGSGNAYSATVGYPWVKAIADLFEAGPNGSNTTVNGKTTTTPNLIMSFTHDNNLPPIISALGMWNATGLMSTSNRTEHEFRSSWLVAMRGYLALERMTCVTSGNYDVATHIGNTTGIVEEKNATTAVYVRVRTDHAPQALPGCSSGPGLSCPFEDWKNYIAERGEIAGDFVETCGLTISNATGVLSIYSETPMDSEVLGLSINYAT